LFGRSRNKQRTINAAGSSMQPTARSETPLTFSRFLAHGSWAD
jgi:hypothetical protein